MKKPLLLLLVLALFGCPPPYNADVNLASSLTAQMTLAGTAGPLSVSGSDLGAVRSNFFPVRDASAAFFGTANVPGFAQGTDGFYDYVQAPSGSDTFFGRQYELFGSDSNYPPIIYAAGVSTASTGYLFIIGLDPGTAGLPGQFQVASIPLPTGNLAFAGPIPLQNQLTVFSNPWNTAVVVGLSVMADPAIPGQDLSFWLLRASGLYAEEQFTMNPAGAAFVSPVPATPSSFSLPIPALARYQYFHDPQGGVSYASFLSGGSWQCWSWLPGGTPIRQLTGITSRVDALLSTGELLSFEGDVLRVYDPAGNGSMLTSVPLGSLRYCYETYVGGTPYVFFCQTLYFGRGKWGYRLFAMESSQVKGLR